MKNTVLTNAKTQDPTTKTSASETKNDPLHSKFLSSSEDQSSTTAPLPKLNKPTTLASSNTLDSPQRNYSRPNSIPFSPPHQRPHLPPLPQQRPPPSALSPLPRLQRKNLVRGGLLTPMARRRRVEQVSSWGGEEEVCAVRVLQGYAGVGGGCFWV